MLAILSQFVRNLIGNARILPRVLLAQTLKSVRKFTLENDRAGFIATGFSLCFGVGAWLDRMRSRSGALQLPVSILRSISNGRPVE